MNGSASGSVRVATIDPSGHDHRNIGHGGDSERPDVTAVPNAVMTEPTAAGVMVVARSSELLHADNRIVSQFRKRAPRDNYRDRPLRSQ